MKCPRCGLHNPQIAERCDCGYDFQTKTVKGTYSPQTLRKSDLLVVAGLVCAYNLAGIAIAVVSGNALRLAWLLFCTPAWMACMWVAYLGLIAGKNSGRIILYILLFPASVWFLGRFFREAKMYCMQRITQ